MIFNIDSSIFKTIDYYLNTTFSNKCSQIPPTEIKLNKNSRIIAIGDIHGDFHSLLHALYKAKVINTNGIWTGNNTIVIQLGDLLDKGGRDDISVDLTKDGLEELKIIEYMNYLHKIAIKVGGGVYGLIGNHELMNMLGDFRYVTQEHLHGFGGKLTRQKLFSPGGPIAIKLACNTNGIMKIGDWIFVHAGLLPEHIEKYTLYQINSIVRDILLGKTNITNLDNDILNLVFNKNSLFWNRYYTVDTDEIKCNKLYKTLNILKIGKKGGMVVGHTPIKNINSKCNKKLWMTDVGMSSAFGYKQNKCDRVEILEIIDNGKVVRSI